MRNAIAHADCDMARLRRDRREEACRLLTDHWHSTGGLEFYVVEPEVATRFRLFPVPEGASPAAQEVHLVSKSSWLLAVMAKYLAR
jgi:hypothetical protein